MKCKDCTNYICHHRTTDAERDCFFEEQMVIKTNKLVMEFIDWDKFRREAAKDILAGILAHANICISETEKTRLTKLALSYTEELIRQLKERRRNDW